MRCQKAIQKKCQVSSYVKIQGKENQWVGAWLGKLHKSENCSKRKGKVFIGLWVTVSVSISFQSRKPGFLASTTNRMVAGGTREQGELFAWSSIYEASFAHPLQPCLRGHLQNGIPARVSSQFFSAKPHLATFPSVSLFHFRIKKTSKL